MKNKLITIVLVSVLMLFSKQGITDLPGKYYFGLQYADADYTDDDYSKSFEHQLLVTRFGGYINSNFSIEARLGFGLQDDTQFLPEFGVSGLDVTLELDSMMGFYATGRVDMTESSSIYGVLGVTDIEATAVVPQFPMAKSSHCKNGPSYGIGVNVGFGKNTALNIEYMQYLDKSDFDLSAIGIGVIFNY
ncbi:MAG: porin family protein [Gammaproteobacteria bacterium]|nr:porin family protein [Gammaproteobacteria bacterium]MCW8924319.1 porin family protein [Gammaproteobacteria bacterium]